MADSFHPINLPGQVPKSGLGFDLFIYFKGKYLRYKTASSEVGQELLNKLKNQKITRMYVLSQQRDNYNNLIKSLLGQVLGKQENFTDAQRIDILSTSASTSVQQLCENPQDRMAYNMTEMACRGLLEVLLRNPFAIKAFFDINLMDSEVYLHSQNVATLSVVLGRKMGLKSELLLQLAIAALLHDIGLNWCSEEEKKIFKTPIDKLTKDQRKFMHNHAKKAAEVLQKNELISPLVIDLVAHHESNLSDSPDLSLSGQVLSMANQFDMRVSIHGSDPSDAYKNMKLTEIGNYQFKMLNTFGDILKASFF